MLTQDDCTRGRPILLIIMGLSVSDYSEGRPYKSHITLMSSHQIFLIVVVVFPVVCCLLFVVVVVVVVVVPLLHFS